MNQQNRIRMKSFLFMTKKKKTTKVIGDLSNFGNDPPSSVICIRL